MAVPSAKKLSLNQDVLVDDSPISVGNYKANRSGFLIVPWPDWNDVELNNEVWDESKRVTVASNDTRSIGNYFEDTEPPELPVSIKGEVRSWKRPHEVFRSSKLTVYNPTSDNFELWIPSILARFSFYRYFNEILPLLQFYALKYGFPVEWETSKFVANTQGEPWKPWHHVYSFCKAGKGQVHKPVYNPYGKYIVRLFYMGCWRQFLVDDKIPCDMNEECMLPCTKVPGELWPILITKAIFKIISLTPTMNFSLNDFPLISVFTGWVSVKVTTLNKSEEEIWRRLCALLPHYEPPQEKPLLKEEKQIKMVAPTARDKTSSKVSSSKGTEKKREHADENFCFLSATLEEFPECQTLVHMCTIALTMVRDCPLKQATRREKTKLWKRLRWMYWALEKGIWMDEKTLPPYRRIHYITHVREISPFLAPDPKQETTMFDVSVNESSNISVKSNKEYEFEDWGDFYKFYEYVLDLNICLKPSFFHTIFQISCLTSDSTDNNKVYVGDSAGPKTTSRISPPPPSNIFYYFPIVKFFGNEPGYLFCESLSEIFLCFSLSVCPEGIKRYAGYLEAGQPEFLKIGHACLLVETYDWKTLHQGEIIGFVKTVGNSTTGFNLKPGRHALKLWLFSDSSYVANVYSNVEIGVYDGSKLRFLMGLEAERILVYIDEVSNAFIALTQKFGKHDLSIALRQFYSAIFQKPSLLMDHRSSIDTFVEVFLNSIVLSLKTLITNTEELKMMVGALRSLFINLNIECTLPFSSSSAYDGSRKGHSKKTNSVKDRSLSEVLNRPWTIEEISLVIRIQKIFRGYRVRLLLKHQQPSRKEFKNYAERLKKICDFVFVPNKREIEVGKIIRNVVMSNPSLIKAFKFHEDLSKVIQVEEFTGKISNVEPMAWVPIARFIVACHCKEPVPCAFYFSCNLEEYVIQAVDNDTNKELFRIAGSVSPYYYSSNMKGYTIFAFGWNKANAKVVNWRIEMVRMKHFQVLHLCNTLLNTSCHPYTIPNVEVFEVKNYYVPNHKLRICRFLIKVYKTSLLTLRLSTSYSEVNFRLTVYLDKKFCPVDVHATETNTTDKVLAKTVSLNGAVLLPSVFLECFEPNPWYGESAEEGEPTKYIVEAFVLNNSWPLTKQEWGVVEPLRVNGENWKQSFTSITKTERSDSRKRMSKSSKRLIETKALESPYWLLQVLHDTSEVNDPNEGFTIEEDKSTSESLKELKISWEEKDPGRRKRGRDLRLKFLNSIVSETDGDSKIDDDRSLKKSTLDRLSNFSYLTEDTSPMRFAQSPRILPKMPTQELLKKYKKSSKQKVLAEIEHLMSGYAVEFEDDYLFSEQLTKFLPAKAEVDRKKFLLKTRYYRDVMEKFFSEEFKLSILLMEKAYEGRLKAIERLMR